MPLGGIISDGTAALGGIISDATWTDHFKNIVYV